MATLGRGHASETACPTPPARSRSRANGALLSILPVALWQQATALTGQGRFKLAYAAAEEGIRLASDFGHRRARAGTSPSSPRSTRCEETSQGRAPTPTRPWSSPRSAAGDLDRRLRRVGARAARAHAGQAERGDRPPAARERRRAARVESADRDVVDPRPDRSGGTLRAARRDGGSIRPLHGLGAALAVPSPPVGARPLPRARGRGRRARAVRDGARARRDALAVPAGPHRAALRRVAATRAPAARGAPASAQSGRPLPPGRRAAVGGARRGGAARHRRDGQASATPRRSTSSPRRSCRSPGSSPPA